MLGMRNKDHSYVVGTGHYPRQPASRSASCPVNYAVECNRCRRLLGFRAILSWDLQRKGHLETRRCLYQLLQHAHLFGMVACPLDVSSCAEAAFECAVLSISLFVARGSPPPGASTAARHGVAGQQGPCPDAISVVHPLEAESTLCGLFCSLNALWPAAPNPHTLLGAVVRPC